MDAGFINTVSEILNKGGSAALFIALWIAFRAARTAQEAVSALFTIRDAVTRGEATLKDMARDVHDIDQRARNLETAGAQQALKLDALLARAKSNVS